MKLVAFVAVVLYVVLGVEPAVWHEGSAPETVMVVGVPTVGVIVTVCVALVVPLQPVAVAVITLVPL